METVKKYKVIALNVGADSNKIFYSGDIIKADAWAEPEQAEKLVKQGFLEPYEGKEEEVGALSSKQLLVDPTLEDQSTNETTLGLPVTNPVKATPDETTAGKPATGKKANPNK